MSGRELSEYQGHGKTLEFKEWENIYQLKVDQSLISKHWAYGRGISSSLSFVNVQHVNITLSHSTLTYFGKKVLLIFIMLFQDLQNYCESLVI